MTAADDSLSQQLNELVERRLGRALSAAERRELSRVSQSLEPAHGFSEQVRAQAEQAVEAGRQKAQAAIRTVLQGTRTVAEQMADEREREDRAVLKMVESASSLAQLRPSVLQGPGKDVTAAGTIVVAQIADRLANLVKAEVQTCFEQQFGPLLRRLEAAAAAVSGAPEPSAPQAPPSPAATPNT